jgi:uncharacterized protein (TIGR02117 family)
MRLSYLVTPFRWLFFSVISITFLTYNYLIFALLISLIPANPFFEETEGGIEVMIISNGVHTDIGVPMSNEVVDWHSFLPMEEFNGGNASYQYVAFGWGDKGFYLNTPEWADLKVSTALNAMFLPSETAMHVSLYKEQPATGERIRKVSISKSEYRKLVAYIIDSFEKRNGKQVKAIEFNTTPTDKFFEAEGSYHLFYTCNSWANSGLIAAGIKTALWAPFDKLILRYFPE